MKNIIIYASMTGHSKKIAQAISEKLGIEAFNIKDNPKIEGYDMGIFVSGIYSGECKMELIEFAKKLTPANIKSALLVTSSMKEMTPEKLKEALIANQIEVMRDEYTCKGGFLVMGISHPNKQEIDEAVDFVRNHLYQTV